MRLLIASDIHGSLAAVRSLRAAAERLNPDMLVLLGDILYHGPRNRLPEEYAPAEAALRFREWLAERSLPLMCVRGNCDAEVDAMMLPFPLAESAWLFADGAHIFAMHGHGLPAGGVFPALFPVPHCFAAIRTFPGRKSARVFTFGIPAVQACPRGTFHEATALLKAARFPYWPLRAVRS